MPITLLFCIHVFITILQYSVVAGQQVKFPNSVGDYQRKEHQESLSLQRLRTRFDVWVTQQKKMYHGGNQERSKRFRNWVKTDQKIQKHNSRKDVSWKMEHNEFSDWTDREFELYFGLLPKKDRDHGNIFDTKPKPYTSKKALPDYVNWVEKGKVSSIKNQGACRACSHFAAVAAIESTVAIMKNNTAVQLSEQQVIDCHTSTNGCRGGWYARTINEVARGFGLCSSEDYPYEDVAWQVKEDPPKKHVCRRTNCTMVAGTNEILKARAVLPRRNARSIMEQIVESPVVVTLHSRAENFKNYAGGVFDEPDCPSKPWTHAMLVVGYGVDEDSGKPYWLMKNSWSVQWGEVQQSMGTRGFVRIARDVNSTNDMGMCGMQSRPVYVQF